MHGKLSGPPRNCKSGGRGVDEVRMERVRRESGDDDAFRRVYAAWTAYQAAHSDAAAPDDIPPPPADLSPPVAATAPAGPSDESCAPQAGRGGTL